MRKYNAHISRAFEMCAFFDDTIRQISTIIIYEKKCVDILATGGVI